MLKISRAALIAAALTAGSFATHSFAQELSLDSPGDAESSAPGDTTSMAPNETGASFSVDIPTIIADGSSMDEAALRELFTGGFKDQAGQLATLNANRISIPTVTYSFSNAQGAGEIVLHDISLDSVAAGVAATASVGSVEVKSKDGGFTSGTLTATQLDFGTLLGYYGLTAPLTGSDFRVAYTGAKFDGGTLTFPQGNCTIGSIESGQVELKQTSVSFLQYIEATQTSAAGTTPSPEQMQIIFDYIAESLVSQRGGTTTVNGFDCSGTSPDGTPFSFKMGKMSTGGMQPGLYPAYAIEDISVSGGEMGNASLKSFVFKPIDFTGPVAVYQAAPRPVGPDWFTVNARKLVPAWDGLAFSGLDFDVVNPEAESTRVIGGIGEFDLTLGHYTNGIPADISSFAKNIKYNIPTNTMDPQQQMMLALGMSQLDLGYNIKLGWDEASKTVRVDDVSVNGANLGSIAVASTIGNALPQLFDVNPQIEQAAAMSLTLQNLNLNLVDAGLGDIIVTVLAGQQGVDPAQMRTALAGQAAGSVLQIFGSTPEAQGLSDAIGAFVGGQAKSLGISLVSKDPTGLPLPLLMQGSQDPSVLINQVTVTGKAQ